jgi:hypothetical protein
LPTWFGRALLPEFWFAAIRKFKAQENLYNDVKEFTGRIPRNVHV